VFHRTKIVVIVWFVAVLCVATLMAGLAIAQKTPPKPQDKVGMGEADVTELLLLMDTDKSGKVSKQEFMKFMEAEFNRLDKDKSGELDVKELLQMQRPVRIPPAVGK